MDGGGTIKNGDEVIESSVTFFCGNSCIFLHLYKPYILYYSFDDRTQHDMQIDERPSLKREKAVTWSHREGCTRGQVKGSWSYNGKLTYGKPGGVT